MNRAFLLVLAATLLWISGCASIINGTTQKIPITSEPANATVTAVGGDKAVNGVTPCTLELKRKHPQVLTISAPGYKSQTVQLESVLSGAVAGNILAGGLIGWGVDAASGADSRLTPEAVSVTLALEEVATQPGPTVDKAMELETDLKRLEELLASGSITQDEHNTLRQKTLEKY